MKIYIYIYKHTHIDDESLDESSEEGEILRPSELAPQEKYRKRRRRTKLFSYNFEKLKDKLDMEQRRVIEKFIEWEFTSITLFEMLVHLYFDNYDVKRMLITEMSGDASDIRITGTLLFTLYFFQYVYTYVYIYLHIYLFIGTNRFRQYKVDDLLQDPSSLRNSLSPYVYMHDCRGRLSLPGHYYHIREEVIKPDSYIFSMNDFKASDKPLSPGSEVIVLEPVVKGLEKDDFRTWFRTNSRLDEERLFHIDKDFIQHLESALQCLLNCDDINDLLASSLPNITNHGLVKDLSKDSITMGEFDGIYFQAFSNPEDNYKDRLEVEKDETGEDEYVSFWCEKQLYYVRRDELMCPVRESISRLDINSKLRKEVEIEEEREVKKKRKFEKEMQALDKEIAASSVELEEIRACKKARAEKEVIVVD